MIAWLAPIGGLAALAGLPLVIHLLSRQTRRERPFPALALLRRAIGGRAQISALRERVALLLRMLALAALLLAAAAPVWHAGWVGSGAPVVILIDASASMHQRVGATDAWTEALGTASRLADETAPRPAMVFVAGSPLRRSSPQPEADRGALRALLADARPGWGAGSLDAAVAAALSSMAGHGDLYVITDGSRNALAGVDPGALPTGIAWHHVAVTGGGANCAIRAIALEPGGARVGRPLQVQAEVANFGPEAAALTVRLTIGESGTEQPVTVPPGGSVTVSRTTTPDRAGVLELGAAIVAKDVADALPEDDRRVGSVRVLSGEPLRLFTDADPQDSVGVVRPLVAAARAAGLMTTTRPGSALLNGLNDSEGGSLVLTAGLAQADAGPALLDHLRQGGVWLQVTASDADARLTAAGIDPPAKPGALVDLTARPRGLMLGARQLDQPLTAGLLGREPLLARLEAWRYRPAPPLPGAKVLLAWADGSAALALRPVGPGWWIQLGISPADGDTSLAALEVLPLIMAHLSDVGGIRRLADAAVPCDAIRRATTASDPDGVASGAADGSVRLTRPGRWTLDGATVAAAISASEGDLRQVAASADRTTSDVATAIASSSDRPLWPWCLLAAAVLLMSELLLVGGLPHRSRGGA